MRPTGSPTTRTSTSRSSSRWRGVRIELVPSVRVVHGQGASSPSSEVAVQRRDANQARFVARQAPLLAHRWHTLDLPHEPHRYYAARDVDVPGRVLAVVDALPAPNLPQIDDAHTRLTVAVSPAVLAREPGEVRRLRDRGIEVAADAERAVVDRLFLLDEVVAPAAWLAAHAGLLAEHQPQARYSSSAIDPSSRPNT